VLIAGLTVWDDTDGCGKQYRCGTAMYLLSILASKYGIIIDRAIGAPGHGKDIVDGLNATDKVYLRKAMCMIGTPEANDGDKRMAAHAMLGDEKMSLAAESCRLCSDPARFEGVKAEGGKRQKREAAAKMKERHYHVQDPCACSACLAQLEKPWVPGVAPEEQPMFASSTDCFYWPIFKKADGEPGWNDWKIVTLEKKKDSVEDEAEAHAEILEGIETMMAESIEEGKYGAFATEDDDGFYVIKFTSSAYTLQDDVELTEYTPEARAHLRHQQAAARHEQEEEEGGGGQGRPTP